MRSSIVTAALVLNMAHLKVIAGLLLFTFGRHVIEFKKLHNLRSKYTIEQVTEVARSMVVRILKYKELVA